MLRSVPQRTAPRVARARSRERRGRRAALAAVATLCTTAAAAAGPGVAAGQPVAPAAERSGSAPALVDPATTTAWRLPVHSSLVLDLFDPPAVRWGRGHRGVDLEAEEGAEVLAPADGVVTFAGWVVNRAVLTTAHPGGVLSSVEPVAATVTRGDMVRAGDIVGTLDGATAHCTRSCVHWGVRVRGDYVDPLGLLADRPEVVLLP